MAWTDKSRQTSKSREQSLKHHATPVNIFTADPGLYTLPYWSNPPFSIFDIRALWRSRLSARAPERQKIKNVRLDQYDAGPFEQQQFGTADVEGVEELRPEAATTKERLCVILHENIFAVACRPPILEDLPRR